MTVLTNNDSNKQQSHWNVCSVFLSCLWHFVFFSYYQPTLADKQVCAELSIPKYPVDGHVAQYPIAAFIYLIHTSFFSKSNTVTALISSHATLTPTPLTILTHTPQHFCHGLISQVVTAPKHCFFAFYVQLSIQIIYYYYKNQCFYFSVFFAYLILYTVQHFLAYF